MKIALITGGSRGLGKAAAINLANKGINIILTYNQNLEAAKKTVDELQDLGVSAYTLQLDTGDTKSFPPFVQALKELLQKEFQGNNIDYLLNNAGVGQYSSFLETKEEDFDRLVNIHLKGVYFLTQKILPLINDGGRILNVSSGLARFSYPGYSAYGPIKGAIEVLSRYLAVELGPRKISVNCIAPGAIETDFGNGLVRDNKELNDHIASNTPLGRVGLPNDIGAIMAELLDGNLGWVNGQRIEASGGIHS